MACMTLKRPLDMMDPFEALHSPNRPPTKRRRCTPIKGIDRESTSNYVPPPSPSVFRDSPLSPSEIANQLRDELKRMRRRRQLITDMEPTHRDTPSPTMPSSPGGSFCPPEFMMDSSSAMQTVDSVPQQQPQSSSKQQDKPVFSLKQMTLICEKMCQERTNKVREEYDRILQQKLSEQYDAFVRFIDHQIQRRFNESQLPSYLS